jgi:hypothetical protein
MNVIVEGKMAKVALPPVLNERFNDGTIAEVISAAEAILFDFDACQRITSFGIREWTRLLKQIPDTGYYGFVRVRPQVVVQFNVVHGFAGRGELLSMYVPYACPKCPEKFELLIDVAFENERIAQKMAPRVQCPNCLVDADMEELPAFYFSFVSRNPKPSPPEALQAAISASMSRRGRSPSLRR